MKNDTLSRYGSPKIQIWQLRTNFISKIIHKLYGFADWFVATGFELPESPFFFIHEYKAEESKSIDGLGQLLATLYVTQELHKIPPPPTFFDLKPFHFYKDIPIYGAYVKGEK